MISILVKLILCLLCKIAQICVEQLQYAKRFHILKTIKGVINKEWDVIIAVRVKLVFIP